MKIISSPNAAEMQFEHPHIRKLKYDTNGVVTVFGPDDTVLNSFTTKANIPYIWQYGTPISEDGRLLFVGTWEQALFCYSLENGKLIWKQNPGKVRKIIPHQDRLYVEMCDRGLFVRRMEDGELIEKIPTAVISHLYLLNDHELFFGPKRDKYLIVDIPTLKVIKQYTYDQFSFQDLAFVFIQNIFYKGDVLTVKGLAAFSSEENAPMEPFERSLLL